MSAADEILIRRGQRTRRVDDRSQYAGWGSGRPSERTTLVGRHDERRELDLVLERARAGRSAVLVLRGEPGVGKTALLDYCTMRAAGFRVTAVAGVESEMELPFAALHQLCAPVLERLEALQDPHRRALRVALGLASGDAPDRLSVALAVLSLFTEIAAERPLLCMVDDAHWLDTASAQTLGVVARRLDPHPVAMVFAARDRPDAEEVAGLPELAIAGLGEEDADKLLDVAVVAAPLDRQVRKRLIAETRGNPLALLELGPAAATTPPSTAVGFPGELSGRIEESFLARLATLDVSTRRLLLLAAVELVGDSVVLRRAAEHLGIEVRDVPSGVEHLVDLGERVTFQHPLVRSAIYRSASPDERRAAHLALARVNDAEGDADRRAWHLAAAARGPDEEVARELERSAGRAQARGGYAAAASFLQRSVTLSRDRAQRTARALAAARASLRAGAFDDARESLVAAEMGALDDLRRAQVELLRGHIAFAAGFAADASALLLKAAGRLESLDLRLARETYLGACGAAIFGGPACAGDLLAVARAVRELPPPEGDPRAIDVLLDGLALLITEGRATAAPTLLRAVAAFAGEEVSNEESLRWGWMATAGSNALWDDAGLRAVCHRHIRLARGVGAFEHLPVYLIALGTAAARGGDLATAASLTAESEAVAEFTGTRLAPFAAQLIVASLRGDAEEVSALKQAAIQQAATSGQGLPTTVAEWSEATLYNGLGRYENALQAALRASSAPGDLFASMWVLPELVEAATRVDDTTVAREAFDRLVATTQPAGTDYGLGVEARSRALISDDEAAEGLYREAIERLGRTELRADQARAHLLYGEWLRRAQQRREAREQLRAARDMFADMGMAAFAERARRELVATGERVRKRGALARDQLTPRESQVAGLASEGLSNSEIAARLFLSPSTVEWHLKKVFAKLGIASRHGLRDALPSTSRGGPSA